MSCGWQSNLLLAGLPDETRRRWLPQLEPVALPQGAALHRAGGRTRHAHFPTTAVVSLVQETADGAPMEIAVVGHEGIVGVELILGGGSMPSRAVVRSAGEVLRLPARAVEEELARAGPAARVLLRYTMALVTQVAQLAVCTRHHSLEQRLCRWLLMSLDRVPGDEIVATQEQIANLLGVRREGVTQAALRLHALGLIRYTRGRIVTLDRAGLAGRACECHATLRKEYARLLPAPPAQAPAWRPAARPVAARVPATVEG